MARIAQQVVEEPCPKCHDKVSYVIGDKEICSACGGRGRVTRIVLIPVDE